MALCDDQVADATEQAVKEKVQLIAVEFLLGLEPEEEHDVLDDSLHIAIDTDKNDGEEFERVDASKTSVVQPLEQLSKLGTFVGNVS